MRFTFILPGLLLLLLWVAGCTEEPLNEAIAPHPVTDIDVEQILSETEQEVNAIIQEIEDQAVDFRSNDPVIIPPDSEDALEDALNMAGPNDTVLLSSGQHTITSTVDISFPIRISGEPGAVLIADVGTANFADEVAVLEPALHLKGADRTQINNLTIQHASTNGSCAILIEDSRSVRIWSNHISGFQLGVLLYEGDRAQIVNNTLTGLQEPERHYGVYVVTGQRVTLAWNDISQFGTGIFASDLRGRALANTLYDNQGDGIIFCKAPSYYSLPDGTNVGADVSASRWFATANHSTGNGELGYSVIDGANNNRLINNQSADNGLLDIVLFPTLELPGGTFPTTFDNLVISLSDPDMLIMDCGENNTVIGGRMVDCFL